MIYSQHVFVLAASNLPWDLDPALLRRLDKRIHTPPPNEEARKAMIQKLLLHHPNNFIEKDFLECAASTKGFSGADIKLICQEAAMITIRSLLKKLENSSFESNQTDTSLIFNPDRLQKLLRQNPLCISDFQKSLLITKSSLAKDALKRYEDWAQSYGCT